MKTEKKTCRTLLMWVVSIIITLWALTWLVSCEPDPIIVEPVITRVDLLTSYTWNFDSLTITISDIVLKPWVNTKSVLNENGTIKFNTDGSYIKSTPGFGLGLQFYDNINNCGTWEFNTDKTTIHFDFGKDWSFITPILKLNNISFKFKQTLTYNREGIVSYFDIIYYYNNLQFPEKP